MALVRNITMMMMQMMMMMLYDDEDDDDGDDGGDDDDQSLYLYLYTHLYSLQIDKLRKESMRLTSLTSTVRLNMFTRRIAHRNNLGTATTATIAAATATTASLR